MGLIWHSATLVTRAESDAEAVAPATTTAMREERIDDVFKGKEQTACKGKDIEQKMSKKRKKMKIPPSTRENNSNRARKQEVVLILIFLVGFCLCLCPIYL